ncbi:PRC-barrel domain-containing protein [Falsirhodobacter sp. 1013]|uniref:PRC-barrel domain-containing protein n=1 Tax=Falsirhodobacter sp. 1013 TaxID=3417566 RepID=UPI003EBB2671
MLKTTLLGLLFASAATVSLAQAPDAPNAPSNPTPEDVQTVPGTASPNDADPDLETEPLTNRSTHEGFGRAFTDPVTAERIEGAGVYAQDEEKVGSISDLVMNADGQVQDVVMTIGGVMGVGGKTVALPMDQVELVQAHEGEEVRAYLPMSKDEIEALPEHEH